ncbi:protein FAM13A isoform X2, partial [Clarias magur]
VDIEKENISGASVSLSVTAETERRPVTADEDSRSRNPKHSPTLTELSRNQASLS